MTSKQILAQRGRRPLLWGLALFVGSQIALAVVLERAHPELIEPEFGTRWQLLHARVTEQPGRPLVLVLGNSRTAMGFRPDALPTLPSRTTESPLVFNYAMVGAGPLTQRMVLNRLLDRGIEPAVVLVEVWPVMLTIAQHLTHGDDALLSEDLPLVWRYYEPPWPALRTYAENRLLGAFGHRQQLQAQLLPWALPGKEPAGTIFWRGLDGSGWLPCPINFRADNYQAFEAQQRAAWSPKLQQFQPDPSAERALRELLDTCQRRKIAVALLTMPEAGDFRGYYSAAALASFDTYMTNLCRQHAVSFIDARMWSADEDFADGVHLMPSGAAMFMERLGREALTPLLASELLAARGRSER